MALVAEADACLDSIEDIEELTPRQWPQCHRADASPSRILQEGFAQLLDKWMRHPSIEFDSNASIAWGIFATSCLTSSAFWVCAA